MVIRDARIEECASCDREFDLNFPARMQRYQKLHRREQMHFWPCAFLTRKYYPIGFFADLYDTPWESTPRRVFFHSDECEEAYTRSGSFDYIDCDGCRRTVCEQNPANGWHVQFRDHVDLGYICLRCYEKEILGNGQPRSDFEGSRIRGGMFFSSGNSEPRQNGFDEVSGFTDYFVDGAERARHYNEHALELINKGQKIITAYERLAIGGLEGYITMLSKMGDRPKKDPALSEAQPRAAGRRKHAG